MEILAENSYMNYYKVKLQITFEQFWHTVCTVPVHRGKFEKNARAFLSILKKSLPITKGIHWPISFFKERLHLEEKVAFIFCKQFFAHTRFVTCLML